MTIRQKALAEAIKAWYSAVGGKGGASKSATKRLAAKRNGRAGGRPRKVKA